MKIRPVYIFMAVFVFGCSMNDNQKEVTGYDPSLIVLDGAININYSKYHGNDQLTYLVDANFPAKPEVSYIEDKLESAGWKRTTANVFSQDTSSTINKEWIRFIDGTQSPNNVVHQLAMSWENERADVVTYFLRYKYPWKGEKDLKSLKIAASYTPAEIVKEIQEFLREESNGSSNKSL